MIVKHESNNIIQDIPDSKLIDFVDGSIRIIRNSISILEALQEKDEDLIDEDDELELLESCQDVDAKPVLYFKSTSASIYDSINFYVAELYNVITNNNDNLDRICDSGVYVTEEWAEILKSENERIVGGLCYVLWYEFNIDRTVQSMGNGDVDIDRILKGYFDACNIELLQGIKMLQDWKEQYKFKLMVFDEYPEKEDEFIRLMGPYLGGLDSTKLTIELVDKVISGEMSAMELSDAIQRSIVEFD